MFKGDKSKPGSNGDTVKLPEKKGKDKKNSDAEYTYKLIEPKQSNLNLQILNVDFTPIKDAEYEFKIADSSKSYKAKTDGQGEIFVKDIPILAQKGKLVVRMSADEAKKSEENDTESTEPKVKKIKGAVEGDVPVSWELKIGRLNPIMEQAPDKWCTSGVQQRLNNLKIYSGPVDGIRGPNTKAAIEKFQCMFKLKKDGKAGQKETQPKLVEVHDNNSYTGNPPPAQPKNITPIPANKKLETKPEDIGHIAPDDKKGGFFNTLRGRPVYKISLMLGDIENLFPWKINTKAGRLARLQVLGLFYWPLNHRIAAGKTAMPVGVRNTANQAGYNVVWEYFKKNFCGNGDDAAAETELKKRLKEWVVQKYNGTADGSSYNSSGETTGGGELPIAADEDKNGNLDGVDETQGNFAKIRLPGGWSFFTPSSGPDPNKDTSINGMKMYDSVYDFENGCYAKNPVLGKIPLIALVEEFWPTEKKWKPADNIDVYFQLLKPYDLPPFDKNRKAHQQVNKPPLIGSAYSVTHPTPPTYDAGQGAKYYMEEVWDKYKFDPKADDPQVNNCHKECGGKRGCAVSGSDPKKNLFMTGTFPGFNAEHETPPNDILDEQGGNKRVLDSPLSLKEVETVSGSDHPHSVKCLTNEDGQAGIIFTPSRCAGDRYRIRAYVGPETIEGTKGSESEAVRVDTGTLVVWRSIRISRFVRQEITGWNQYKLKMINHYFKRPDTQARSQTDRKNFAKKFGVVDAGNNWVGLPDIYLDRISDGKVGSHGDGIRVAYAKAFCEFEYDPALSEENKEGMLVIKPEKLTGDEWKKAVTNGIEDAKLFANHSHYKKFDLDKLLYRNLPGDADIDVDNGFILPARPTWAYAQAGGPHHAYLTVGGLGKNANYWKGTIIKNLFKSYIYAGFMRYITKNGFLPGVTIVQSGALTNLEAEAGFGLGLRGRGTHFAGAFVMRGKDTYMEKIGIKPRKKRDYTSTAVHEIGHVIFKVHAPGKFPSNEHAGGYKNERHDSYNDYMAPKGDPKHGVCVMSYRTCEGFHCSRCLLQLRGWNILDGNIKDNNTNPLSFDAVPMAQGRHTKIYVKKQTDVNFGVTPSGGSGTYIYSWKFGDGSVMSAAQNPTHKFVNAGDYTVSVKVTDKNDAGKSAKGSLTVHITEPISITAGPTANPSPAAVNQEISFSVTPSGGSGEYIYSWKFGDASIMSAGAAPKHKYRATGTYTGTIKMTDKNDNTNIKEVTLTVQIN